jgi:hypothetical protein
MASLVALRIRKQDAFPRSLAFALRLMPADRPAARIVQLMVQGKPIDDKGIYTLAVTTTSEVTAAMGIYV